MFTSAIGLLGILYVVIAGNYVGDMFSCDLQRILTKSIVCKHIIVLFGALFWVAEVVDSQNDGFATVVGKAIGIYVMFVMSTKSKSWALIPALVLVIIDQVLRIYVNKSPHVERVKVATRVRNPIQIMCVLLLVVGFVAYALRQMREHSDTFSVSKFLLGTSTCRSL